MKRIHKLLLLFIALILVTSCGKDEDRDQIPYVLVNFSIYPNTIDFIAEGQYVYSTGGYKGLIIYRPQSSEFKVYERACPHDPLTEGARVTVDDTGIIAVDSVCGSQYILTDGSPIKGPAGIALKQYRTSWDGNELRIYN